MLFFEDIFGFLLGLSRNSYTLQCRSLKRILEWKLIDIT